MEWFDEFYRDKDIILSPNVPFILLPGTFDGFPTGTAVDAALRKTAVFATDDLQLNTTFIDGQDLVIIPHDAGRIVETIEHYYQRPDALKTLAEMGARRVRELYSHESQIAPRLAVLKEQLAVESAVSLRRTARTAVPKLGLALWRSSPLWFRTRVRAAASAVRSHHVLFRAVRRICPEPVIRLYRQMRASEARH